MSTKFYLHTMKIREGVLNPMYVWILVSNGIFFGKVASDTEISEVIRANCKDAEGDQKEVTDTFLKNKATFNDLLKEHPEAYFDKIITLIHVKGHIAEVELKTPIAEINAHEIIAWGPGEAGSNSEIPEN